MNLIKFSIKRNFHSFLIEENSSSLIVINGIFASDHPVATVRSTFLQIIARGAV
jgi:hypothetical protein